MGFFSWLRGVFGGMPTVSWVPGALAAATVGVAVATSVAVILPIIRGSELVDPRSLVVESALEAIRSGTFDFKVPEELNRDEGTKVSLTVRIEDSQQAAAVAELAPELYASLAGGRFEIDPLQVDPLTMTTTDDVVWKWDISPERTGVRELSASLTAVMGFAGFRVREVVWRDSRTVDVDATSAQLASDFVASNWQWLWVAIIVPIGGVLLAWWRRRRAHSSFDAADPPDPRPDDGFL